MANLSTKSALFLILGASAASVVSLFGPGSASATQYCLASDSVSEIKIGSTGNFGGHPQVVSGNNGIGNPNGENRGNFGNFNRVVPSRFHNENGTPTNNIVPCDSSSSSGQPVNITNNPTNTSHGGVVNDHSKQEGGKAYIEKGAVDNTNKAYGGQVVDKSNHEGGDSHVGNGFGNLSPKAHSESGVKNSGNSYVGPAGNNNGNTHFGKGSLSPKAVNVDKSLDLNANSNKNDNDNDNTNTNVGINGQDQDQKQKQQQQQNQQQQNIQGQKTDVRNGNKVNTTDLNVNDVDNTVKTTDVNKVDNKQVGIQATDASSRNKLNNGNKIDTDASSKNANKNQTGDQSTLTQVDASDRSVNVVKTEIDAREDARNTSVNIAPATAGITSLTVYNACGVPLSSTNVAAQSEGIGFGLSQFGGLGGSFGLSWQSFNDQQKGLLEQMNMQITTNVQNQLALGSSWTAMRPIARNSYSSMFRRTTKMKDAEITAAVDQIIAALDVKYSTQGKWEATQARVVQNRALLCGGKVTTIETVQQPEYVPTTPTKATPSVNLNVPVKFTPLH